MIFRARRAPVAELLTKLGIDAGRVEIQTDSSEGSALATAVNHLLTRAAAVSEREANPAIPKMFGELGDRIHEAVLVHRDAAVVRGVRRRQRVHVVGRRVHLVRLQVVVGTTQRT